MITAYALRRGFCFVVWIDFVLLTEGKCFHKLIESGCWAVCICCAFVIECVCLVNDCVGSCLSLCSSVIDLCQVIKTRSVI
jgi:hypothetical protein